MPKNFEPKRLDDMEFEEVSARYAFIFAQIIGKRRFRRISELNKKKYNRMKKLVGKRMKFKGGAMGRGDLQYGRNMLYGWFLEELMLDAIKKNSQVRRVKFFGEDKYHDFKVEKRKIVILGKKSTEPDYLIGLKKRKGFLLELKSAAKDVYSIKKGNVESLIRSFVKYSLPTAIVMIDLNSAKYEAKGIDFFQGKRPFVNQRMEGQLCYNFPEPSKLMENFKDENLERLAARSEKALKKNEYCRKTILLKKAKELGNEDLARAIKGKMRIEKLGAQLKVQTGSTKARIKKIKEKGPYLSWKKIEEKLRKQEKIL